MSNAAEATDQGQGGISARPDRVVRRERIRAAADHAAQCHEAWRLAVQARNELIVDAFEADHKEYSERVLATWARLSQPRVHGIIAAT